MATVEIDRVLDAPPERVRRALTDAAELTAWFWPPRLEPDVVVEPRTGGRWRVSSVPGEMGIEGVFTEFTADLLAWTWRWDGEDEERESVVVVTLVPTDDGGTRLRVRHDHLPSDAAADHAEGWEACLERLPRHLAAGPAEPVEPAS